MLRAFSRTDVSLLFVRIIVHFYYEISVKKFVDRYRLFTLSIRNVSILGVKLYLLRKPAGLSEKKKLGLCSLFFL